MNKSCAGPPTRNQVSSASDWLARSRPRSYGIFVFRSGAMSGKLMRLPSAIVSSQCASTMRPAATRRRAVGIGLRRASVARIDAGLAELDGVADQPTLERARARPRYEIAARVAPACGRTPGPGRAPLKQAVRIRMADRNCRHANAAPVSRRAAPAPRSGRLPSVSPAPSRSP